MTTSVTVYVGNGFRVTTDAPAHMEGFKSHTFPNVAAAAEHFKNRADIVAALNLLGNPNHVKVSAWLADNVGSHAIQDHAKLAAKFLADTGNVAPWPSHSVTQARKDIEARGLGGDCKGQPNDRVCYGYEVAASCASVYANFHSEKFGRGSAFWDCVEALKRAGL